MTDRIVTEVAWIEDMSIMTLERLLSQSRRPYIYAIELGTILSDVTLPVISSPCLNFPYPYWSHIPENDERHRDQRLRVILWRRGGCVDMTSYRTAYACQVPMRRVWWTSGFPRVVRK